MTPRQATDEAVAILLRVVYSPWPQDPEAHASLCWAVDYALDIAKERIRFLGGDLDPDDIQPPPAAPRPDDPEHAADETTATRLYDAARAAEKRLAGYQRRETSTAAA